MPLILAIGRQSQVDLWFKTSHDYIDILTHTHKHFSGDVAER